MPNRKSPHESTDSMKNPRRKKQAKKPSGTTRPQCSERTRKGLLQIRAQWSSLPKRTQRAISVILTDLLVISWIAVVYYFLPWVKFEATTDQNKPLFLLTNLSPITLHDVRIGCVSSWPHLSTQQELKQTFSGERDAWLFEPRDFDISPYGQHSFTCPEQITGNLGSFALQPYRIRISIGIWFKILWFVRLQRKQAFDTTRDSRGQMTWVAVSRTYSLLPPFSDRHHASGARSVSENQNAEN